MQNQLIIKQAKPKNQHNPEFANLVHTGGSLQLPLFFAFTDYNKNIKKITGCS
jgi:hypothetical protein